MACDVEYAADPTRTMRCTQNTGTSCNWVWRAASGCCLRECGVSLPDAAAIMALRHPRQGCGDCTAAAGCARRLQPSSQGMALCGPAPSACAAPAASPAAAAAAGLAALSRRTPAAGRPARAPGPGRRRPPGKGSGAAAPRARGRRTLPCRRRHGNPRRRRRRHPAAGWAC